MISAPAMISTVYAQNDPTPKLYFICKLNEICLFYLIFYSLKTFYPIKFGGKLQIWTGLTH